MGVYLVILIMEMSRCLTFTWIFFETLNCLLKNRKMERYILRGSSVATVSQHWDTETGVTSVMTVVSQHWDDTDIYSMNLLIWTKWMISQYLTYFLKNLHFGKKCIHPYFCQIEKSSIFVKFVFCKRFWKNINFGWNFKNL